MFAQVISIGSACQVSYQIRRRSPKASATHFFDWIVTDHQALIDAVPLDFGNLLSPDAVEIGPDARYLRDCNTGLQFYAHDFAYLRGDFLSELETVRERYLRRAERTSALLRSGDPILLVRHGFNRADVVGVAERKAIVDCFKINYPTSNLTFFFTTNLPVEEHVVESGFMAHVAECIDWKGDNASWDRAFSGISL